MIAALLATGATLIIFVERFTQGAWAYLVFIPALYVLLSYFRRQLGEPRSLSNHLGRIYSGQYLLPHERAGKQEKNIVFRDILVPLDGSPGAEAALAVADVLCRSFDCRLTLVSAEIEDRGHTPPSSKDDYLKHTAWRLTNSGLQTDYEIQSGRPHQVIDRMARDVNADLVVMTTHGHSALEELFMSDVAERTIRQVRCPVLLIRPTEQWRSRHTRFEKLLVGLDGSANSEYVLKYARSLAQKFHSRILLLAVPEVDAEEADLRQYLNNVAEALRKSGLDIQALVAGSGPARTIVELSESENADLLILAKKGRAGSTRDSTLGSVANRVIQTAQRPVLLVETSVRSTRKNLSEPFIHARFSRR